VLCGRQDGQCFSGKEQVPRPHAQPNSDNNKRRKTPFAHVAHSHPPITPPLTLLLGGWRTHIFLPARSRCLTLTGKPPNPTQQQRQQAPHTPLAPWQYLARQYLAIHNPTPVRGGERTSCAPREASAEPTGLCGDARARVASRGVQQPHFFPLFHPKVFVTASAHLAPREKQVPGPQVVIWSGASVRMRACG
jgi:hypothetical protein